jgi:glycosyltransferase involved in cell wall biosynthesis
MIGGVENSVYMLVSQLRSLGQEVRVVTASANCAKYEKDVVRLPVMLKLERDWGDLLFCPTILQVMRDLQFDIVHAHTPRKLFAEAVALYKLLSKKEFPYVVSVRLLNQSLQGFWVGALRVYQKTVEKHTLEHARFVIAQTKENKRIIHEDFGIPLDRICIIPNGVDTGFFNPKKYCQQETRDGHEEKTVLFAGRLTNQKGLIYLFNSIPEVEKSCGKVRFHIVGDGPLRTNLQSLAKKLNITDEVIFHGEAKHDGMIKFYSEADIFVLPSLSESFPNVMLEAMSMEKPVVVTRVGAIPEVVTDKENAILVEPGDCEQIATSIVDLLLNDSLRKRLGANARKLVKEKYTWESVAKHTLAIYEEALA